MEKSAECPKTRHFTAIRDRSKIMIKVLFICHGNICRSTLCQSLFTHMVKERGLEDKFYIDSAATSTEEIGNSPHYGTVGVLRKHGIPLIPHRAVQMRKDDYEKYDFLIGMDSWNIRNMNRIAGTSDGEKIYKLLTFAGSGRDVADPWYTGDFDTTYNDSVEGLEAFLSFLEENGYLMN